MWLTYCDICLFWVVWNWICKISKVCCVFIHDPQRELSNGQLISTYIIIMSFHNLSGKLIWSYNKSVIVQMGLCLFSSNASSSFNTCFPSTPPTLKKNTNIKSMCLPCQVLCKFWEHNSEQNKTPHFWEFIDYCKKQIISI